MIFVGLLFKFARLKLQPKLTSFC